MNSRRTVIRLGLAALLALSVLGVSTSFASVAAPGADGGTADEQIDSDVHLYQETIELPPPEPIEPTFHTAPCDATCTD